MRVFKEQDFKTSEWAGGTTKQLYIFPENTAYADRNFQLRISVAKVELEESTFTVLPGYARKLMILEGEIRIFHDGHHSKELHSFEVDAFDGAWNTRSIGKCIDFNVMTTGHLSSELFSIRLNEGQEKKLEIALNSSLFVYVYSGSISVENVSEITVVEKNCLLKVDALQHLKLKLTACDKSDLVIVQLQPMISSN